MSIVVPRFTNLEIERAAMWLIENNPHSFKLEASIIALCGGGEWAELAPHRIVPAAEHNKMRPEDKVSSSLPDDDQIAVLNLIEEGYSIKRSADGMYWGIPPDRSVWIPFTPNAEWRQIARRKKV